MTNGDKIWLSQWAEEIERRYAITANKLEATNENLAKVITAVFGIEAHDYEHGLISQVKAHREYHKKYEPTWGLWTLFKRKPLIPIVLSALFMLILVVMGLNAEAALEWLANRLVRFIR